jgi:hypothetical protein
VLADFLASASPEELAFVRSQYQGKVTMVDRWLGRLFEVIGRLGLWETTAVIVTTDHGHDLGEHGQFGKSYPHYDSHANIPLLIWHPGYAGGGRSVDALTTTADLHATILELAGLERRADLPSRSLVPLLEGRVNKVHEGLIYGTFGQGICCTDGEWTLFQSAQPDAPLFYYSTSIYRPPLAGREVESGHFLPGVELPQWKVPAQTRVVPTENMLFNRIEDPGQECSRWDDAPAARGRLQELMWALIEEQGGCPPEQIARLGLVPESKGRKRQPQA